MVEGDLTPTNSRVPPIFGGVISPQSKRDSAAWRKAYSEFFHTSSDAAARFANTVDTFVEY
jgi:hypothetical protein